MTAFIIFTKSATSPSCYRRRRPLFNMGEEGKKLFFFLLYFVCFSPTRFRLGQKCTTSVICFQLGFPYFSWYAHQLTLLSMFFSYFFLTGPLTHSTLTSLHFGVIVARLTVTVINKCVVCRHSHCVPLWNFVCLLLVFGSFGSIALFLAWPTLLFSLLLLCTYVPRACFDRSESTFIRLQQQYTTYILTPL